MIMIYKIAPLLTVLRGIYTVQHTLDCYILKSKIPLQQRCFRGTLWEEPTL